MLWIAVSSPKAEPRNGGGASPATAAFSPGFEQSNASIGYESQHEHDPESGRGGEPER
jgi:hypothetical protein